MERLSEWMIVDDEEIVEICEKCYKVISVINVMYFLFTNKYKEINVRDYRL